MLIALRVSDMAVTKTITTTTKIITKNNKIIIIIIIITTTTEICRLFHEFVRDETIAISFR